MSIWRRLRAWIARDPDADLAAELRFHLEMEAAELQKAGLAPDAARDAARRRLGGVDRYTEELRDVRGGRGWDALRQDARYALRLSRRFPAFTAIVVLTLGTAIGANTAIFSVVDAVLLRSLPFPDGDRLVLLYGANPDKSLPRFSASYADVLDWRARTRSFSGMAAYTSSSLTMITDREPVRLSGLAATADLFDVLRARPLIGRLFKGNEPEAETSGEIIIAYGLWQSEFAADSGVVGRTTKIGANGAPRTIIGVLPRDFDIDGRSIDAVVVLDPTSIPNVQSHGQHMVSVVGRLAPNVSLAAAQADLASVAARLAGEYPEIKGWSANVFSLRDELVRTIRGPLLILLAAAGLVLLIGCINVANLLITRSTIREREVALRQALGASRGRLMAQLLVESGELAMGGALLGLVAGQLAVRGIVRLAPPGLLPQDIALDPRMLAFALAVAVATTLLVGFWPAVSITSPQLAKALRDGGRTSSGGGRALRVRRSLVVAETSLALVLLVCAGLVFQSLGRMLGVNPGFDPEHVVMMRVSLVGPRYHDTTQVTFFRDLQTRLAARPGIDAVGAANTPPIADGGLVPNIRLLGGARPSELITSPFTAITPGYFKTMGMRLIRGRDVSWTDSRAVVVVSETAVRTYWPGESPIGKRLGFGPVDTIGAEVVGVVNDTHVRGLAADPPPMMYISYQGVTSIARTMSLLVRGRGDLASITTTTKQVLHEVDATLPLYSTQAVSDLLAQSVGQTRLNTLLLTMFAGVALVLAAIGIYGVVSYSVTQRTQEIGVRVALGARQGDVMALVLREGAWLSAAGVLIGVAGTFVATPLIRSWLFGIGSSDPATITATSLALVGVALVASYLPARRASRVDPLVAMRAD